MDWQEDFDSKNKILETHDGYLRRYKDLLASLKEEREIKLMHGNYTPSRLEIRALKN